MSADIWSYIQVVDKLKFKQKMPVWTWMSFTKFQSSSSNSYCDISLKTTKVNLLALEEDPENKTKGNSWKDVPWRSTVNTPLNVIL